MKKNEICEKKQQSMSLMERASYADHFLPNRGRMDPLAPECSLTSEGVIELVKRVSELHSKGKISEDLLNGMLQIFLGQYVEAEIERRLSTSLFSRLEDNLHIFFKSGI